MVRGFIYIILSILLISCSDKGNIDKVEEGEMVNVSIAASIDNSTVTVVSRTTDDTETTLEKFDNADKIGVFLCRADTEGATYHTTSYYLNLMAEYISSEDSWIFFVTNTGLVINPAVYNNDIDQYGNLDCYAYAPYTRTVSGDDDDGYDDLLDDITAVPMINDRDMMWAVGSDPDDSDSNKDIVLSEDLEELSVGLTFKRAMAKIDFTFKLKNKQTGVIVDSIILVAAVDGQKLWESAKLNAINGDVYECVQAADNKLSLSSNTEITNTTTYEATYESKIIPVNIAPKGIELRLIINGQETYNTIPLSAIELKAGYRYTMEITIDNFLKISTTYGLTLDDKWYGEKEEIII